MVKAEEDEGERRRKATLEAEKAAAEAAKAAMEAEKSEGGNKADEGKKDQWTWKLW